MGKLELTYLSNLAPEQRQKVAALTNAASVAIADWATRYPMVQRSSILPCCLHAAATLPFYSLNEVCSWSQIMLWLCMVDDLTDDGRVARERVHAILAECQALLDRTAPAAPAETPQCAHQIGACLGSLLADMAKYPLFTRHRRAFASSISELIASSVKEMVWNDLLLRGDGKLPSLEEYLANGALSIAVPIFTDTVIAMSGDASALAKYDWLKRLGRQVGVVLRLANDLKTHQREQAERKVNALVISQEEHRARGRSEVAALARTSLSDRLRQEIARCEQVYAEDRTDTRYPENGLMNNLRFTSEFYLQNDFHNNEIPSAKSHNS